MKLKTHKTTSKRFKITGSGKIVQSKMSSQHLRANKSRRTLANSKGTQVTAPENVKKIKNLLPNL